MKCPYCEKEMASGYIQNSKQPVHWIPDGESPSLAAFTKAAKGIAMDNEISLIYGYTATAYYCVECGFVIAPTKEKAKERSEEQ